MKVVLDIEMVEEHNDHGYRHDHITTNPTLHEAGEILPWTNA